MEEVIGMEEGSEEDEQCMNNKVKRFCKGYLLECPLLKELEIYRCPHLKTFISRVRLEEMDKMQHQHNLHLRAPALFDDMVAFPSLVGMDIQEMDNMENIWHSQLALGSFCELRKLNFFACEKLPKVFPSVLLGRFQKLEKLSVTDSKNVFPYSIATHLQKLECIDISNSGVEEIVAKAEMNGETTVFTPCFEFPELTNLRFQDVPELRRWYPGMHTLMLPKLKLLFIPPSFANDQIRNAALDIQMPLLLPRKV